MEEGCLSVYQLWGMFAVRAAGSVPKKDGNEDGGRRRSSVFSTIKKVFRKNGEEEGIES